MSSIHIKREKHHRSRSRNRSRSRERVRIKQEPDTSSHQHGHRSQDSKKRDVKREDEHRQRKRNGKDDRSRHPEDREQDNDRHHKGSQVKIKQEREHNDRARRRDRKQRPGNPFSISQEEPENWGNQQGPAGSESADSAPQEKNKPNFGLSGKLTEDTNTFRGVVIKYNEPAEARVPKRKWRFYIFKGQDELPTLHLHRQSAYLLGRDRKIADVPIDHPSCSKQHAVLQYRLVDITKDDGTMGRRVKPYVIDLESANGTFLNNKQIDPRRYYELHEKDVLKFGFSTREYVLLHANSKASDDDVEIN